MPFINDFFYRIYNGNSEKSHYPVVLLHGSGGSHMAWPSDIRRLSGQRVIALDLPGHGKSEIAVCYSMQSLIGSLKSFLQEMHISQAVFIGHSLGAALALQYAAAYPQCVKGLILFACGNKFQISDDLLDLLQTPNCKNKFIEKFSQLAFQNKFPQTQRREILKPLVATRSSVLIADLAICSHFEAASGLARVVCPARLIGGAEDQICSPASVMQLAHLLPKADYRSIPKCGHLLLYEQTMLISRMVSDFLKEVN